VARIQRKVEKNVAEISGIYKGRLDRRHGLFEMASAEAALIAAVLVQRELEFSGSRLSHGTNRYLGLLCFSPATLSAPLSGLG
jgi:hypothetical protein